MSSTNIYFYYVCTVVSKLYTVKHFFKRLHGKTYIYLPKYVSLLIYHCYILLITNNIYSLIKWGTCPLSVVLETSWKISILDKRWCFSNFIEYFLYRTWTITYRSIKFTSNVIHNIVLFLIDFFFFYSRQWSLFCFSFLTFATGTKRIFRTNNYLFDRP